MADLITAKEGDKLTEKARAVIAKRLRCLPSDVQEAVKPKAPGKDGRWVDIDDGWLAQNQIDAHNHANQNPKHRWAWFSFDTNEFEVP